MRTVIPYTCIESKMSRPNQLTHRLVEFRKSAELSREKLALRIGVSAVTVEKWERQERSFPVRQIWKIFENTGICPGWLGGTHPGPIHTADGHPFSASEVDRWEAWLNAKAPKVVCLSGQTGLGGRRLGPHYDRNCCPGPTDLLAYGPFEVSAAEQPQARHLQKMARDHAFLRLKSHFLDIARGVVASADKPEDEERLFKAIAALKKLFPEAKPQADPSLNPGEGKELDPRLPPSSA
jgi:DNA-binding XRE family transcriptional regulator